MLVLVEIEETGVVKSFRNIPRVAVLSASAAGVADILGAASLAISSSALERLEARAGEVTRSGADPCSRREAEARLVR